MKAFALAGFLIVVTCWALAVFILVSRKRRDMKSNLVVWFNVCVGIWGLGTMLTELVATPSAGVLAWRLAHLGGITLGVIFFHISCVLTGYNKRSLIRAVYVYGVIFNLVCLTGMAMNQTELRFGTIYYNVANPLYTVLVTMWVLIVIKGHHILLKGMRVTVGQQREQLRLVLIAMATGFTGGTAVLLPMWGVPLYPYSNFGIPLYAVFVTYAILRHQFLDIKVVIHRGLVYSILIAIITAIYLVIVMVCERLLQGVVGYRSIVGSLLAALIIAIGFNPVRHAIQRWVDRLFFGGSQEALAQENERLREELTRSDRLKSLALLAGGLAHEIKNPLAAMKTFIQYLPERHRDEEFIATCHRILGEEVEKIHSIASNLLAFAKPETLKFEVVSLSRMVDEVVELLHRELLDRRIQAHVDVDSAITITADRVRLKQALLNVCLNSLEAMERGGMLEIAGCAEKSQVLLTIRDTGVGIPPEQLSRVFDPLFTTKSNGTGLGLSIVRNIVKQHGGIVRISSEPSCGTTVTIELPLNEHIKE